LKAPRVPAPVFFFMNILVEARSVPNPKFASSCGFCEVRIRKDTQNL
jgi:hypothetical protein